MSRRPVNVEIWFVPGAGHVGILMDKVPAGTVLRIYHFIVVKILIRPGQSGDRIPVGGRDFPHPARPSLISTQLSVQCVSSLFLEGKVAGAWPCPPTII